MLLVGVLRRYAPVVVAAAVLVPHALLFDFVNDDAYISFRYARNLAEHGQLVFNLGERVEGFTNFLWTILLAGGIKLGIDPITSSRFLGVAFAVGTLGLVTRLSLRLDRDQPSAWHFVAPVGLAATGAFACWSTGGLETQLFTFLALLGFVQTLEEIENQRGFASGASFALAAMARPEGALFFALAVAFRVGWNAVHDRRIRPRVHELATVALFSALFVPYFIWRWQYFGWIFPNTFYVKSSGGAGTWTLGLFYLRRFAEDHGLVLLAPLTFLGWPAEKRETRRALFALAVVIWVAFCAYVIKVGGDFMGLYRFVLPILPLGAVVFQEAVRTLCAWALPRVGTITVALTGLALAGGYIVGSVHVTRTAITFVGAENGIDSPAYLKKYADDRIPIGRWFGKHAQPDDLMTVGGAGVIPYYAGIPAYDVFGLVDETIAHDPSMTVSSRPGHQKWGSDAYMLSRNPTLITHRYCIYTRCGEESWAPAGYEWVHATIPGLVPPYYSFMKRIDRAFGPFPAGEARSP